MHPVPIDGMLAFVIKERNVFAATTTPTTPTFGSVRTTATAAAAAANAKDLFLRTENNYQRWTPQNIQLQLHLFYYHYYYYRFHCGRRFSSVKLKIVKEIIGRYGICIHYIVTKSKRKWRTKRMYIGERERRGIEQGFHSIFSHFMWEFHCSEWLIPHS